MYQCFITVAWVIRLMATTISLSSVLAELTFENWIVRGRSTSDAYRRIVSVEFQYLLRCLMYLSMYLLFSTYQVLTIYNQG